MLRVAVLPGPQVFAWIRTKLRWVPLMGLFLLLSSAEGRASDNPFDARAAQFARDVQAKGTRPESILPLLELWRDVGLTTLPKTRGLLEQLVKSPRLSPARRVDAATLLGSAVAREGNIAEARKQFAALGYITDFRVLGPFDNEGKEGFDVAYPPEQDLGAFRDPNVTYAGKVRGASWRPYRHATVDPYVDFALLFRPRENACAYAETAVHAERPGQVSVWVGTGGASKAWWNGEEVLNDAAYRGAFPNRAGRVVHAQAGSNRLLIKVCAADGPWGVYVRVGDATGGAAFPVNVQLNDVKASVSAPGAAKTDGKNTVVAAGKSSGSRAPVLGDLVALEGAAAGPSPSSEALSHLARYLEAGLADDPAERRAKDLAVRAAEMKPSVDLWLLAARLATERGEKMRFVEKANALNPKDPKVMVQRASVMLEGPRPYDALKIVDALPTTGIPAVHAAILRARILQWLDLDDNALAAEERALALAPNAASVHRELASYAERARRADRVIEERTEALRLDATDTSSRKALIEDALRRGDVEVALTHLDFLRVVDAGTVGGALYLANTYEAANRTEDALAVYNTARASSPDDVDVLRALGDFLLRQKQDEAAADAYRDVQARSPQDAETRELLEHMRPVPRTDEAFATATGTILDRRNKDHDYPSERLEDLTVTTMYPNGLSSRFYQVAIQINDEEGARNLRSFPIQYEPGRQRVDVRMARVYRKNGRVLESTSTYDQDVGDPSYRIYYDSRARIIVLPTLEVGDVVELRYRLDDVTQQNMFNDYFGDLHYLQSDEPIASMRYVLIAPKTRTLYFNQPPQKGLTHTTKVAGDLQIHEYQVTKVPALNPEPSMPGITDLVPYLLVSTYKTWDEAGRWWWGLVKDQLQADDHLKTVVRDLVKGAKDNREKVTRIYDWVVTNTRYVGLEFGIHGYKPYRVPLIVQRGFGDCKDKASLLYVMMREAGIDARIVLLRTRSNGLIGGEPASLSIFDHAIAYVPEFDLYLDGTAENNGVTELPFMDQGVTVLRVGPKDVLFTKSPVLPATMNVDTRQVNIALAADGTATLDVTAEVRGANANAFRSAFEAEGTRRDRLERQLRTVFPGLDLETLDMKNLDNRESPVNYTYHAKAPNMAARNGKQLRMAGTTLGNFASSLARIATRPTRKYVLEPGEPQTYNEVRTIKAPTGYKLKSYLGNTSQNSKFGSFSMKVSDVNGDVRVETSLALAVDRVVPADYKGFREYWQGVEQTLRNQLVWEPVTP